MKIRDDFVTNSSSSSFILALEKKPKRVIDVAQLMPDGKNFIVTGKAAKVLYKDLKRQNPASREEIIQEMSEGWVIGLNQKELYEKCRDEGGKIDRQKFEILRAQEIEKMVDKFLQENEGKQFFIVHCWDQGCENPVILSQPSTYEKLNFIMVDFH